MATLRTLTIPDQNSHQWTINNKGEMLGDLWMTRNLDLESSLGKLRLAERIAILQDGATDQTKWGTTIYPRAFIRTGADGTDRWWALLGQVSSGSPMWNTSGTNPTTGWSQDAIALPPLGAVDSMDVFLQQGDINGSIYDRLVVPDGANDLSMLSNANAQTMPINNTVDGSPISVVINHGGIGNDIYYTGAKVTISGITGSGTGANGTWTITRTSAWTFTLNGSTSGTGNATNGNVISSAWMLKWWSGQLGQSNGFLQGPVVVKKFNVNKLLLIGNSNYVHTIDGSGGTGLLSSAQVAYKRLVFPAGYIMNCIVATPDYAWFFLVNRNGGDAIAARWDGGEQTYETPIPLYDPNVYAAIILDGIPYCINGKGQLLKYDGNAFTEIDVLPCFYTKQIWGDGADFILSPGHESINRNGICVIDGIIHVLCKATMNGDGNDLTFQEDFSSGVWVFNPKSGFYCKYTLGQYRSTDLEWGTKALVRVGGLVPTNIGQGRLLAGAIVFTSTSSQDPAIFYSKAGSSTNNRAQFVTSQLHIPSLDGMYVHLQIVRAVWSSISYSFERFVNSTDRLIIKLRTNHDPLRWYRTLGTCTWVTGGQSFTTTDSQSAAIWENSRIGDEIEIFIGQGAGATAHIASITNTGGLNYTIGLDEAIPNISNGATFYAYLNNWTKISTTSLQTIEEAVKTIQRNSSWIQIKVEMRGTSTSPEFKDMTLIYEALAR